MYSGAKVTTFKERFSDLCNESVLSDVEISRELKVSKQTISAWKCGTRSPKEPTIILIAQFFHVPVNWLMGFDVPKQEETAPSMVKNDPLDPVHLDKTYVKIDDDDVRTFAIGVNEMPPEKKALLLNMARLMFSDFDTYVKKGLAKNVDDDA